MIIIYQQFQQSKNNIRNYYHKQIITHSCLYFTNMLIINTQYCTYVLGHFSPIGTVLYFGLQLPKMYSRNPAHDQLMKPICVLTDSAKYSGARLWSQAKGSGNNRSEGCDVSTCLDLLY